MLLNQSYPVLGCLHVAGLYSLDAYVGWEIIIAANVPFKFFGKLSFWLRAYSIIIGVGPFAFSLFVEMGCEHLHKYDVHVQRMITKHLVLLFAQKHVMFLHK